MPQLLDPLDSQWMAAVQWKQHSFPMKSPLPSGKRLHNELERSIIIHGKTDYFYGHVQSQTVSLPEG